MSSSMHDQASQEWEVRLPCLDMFLVGQSLVVVSIT